MFGHLAFPLQLLVKDHGMKCHRWNPTYYYEELQCNGRVRCDSERELFVLRQQVDELRVEVEQARQQTVERPIRHVEAKPAP